MITLKSTFNEDFLIDATEYPSRPSRKVADTIRHYEREIIRRTDAVLHEPQLYVNEWERLTGSVMPDQYTNDIPEVITSPVYGGKGKGIESYLVELL